MTDRRQTDRQKDHAKEKCVGIGGIASAARSDLALGNCVPGNESQKNKKKNNNRGRFQRISSPPPG